MHVEQIRERVDEIASRGHAELGGFARPRRLHQAQPSEVDLVDGDRHGLATQLKVQLVEPGASQFDAQALVDAVDELHIGAAGLLEPNQRLAIVVAFGHPGERRVELHADVQGAVRAAQRQQLLWRCSQRAINDDVQTAAEQVGVELDQPPGIDQRRARVHPIEPMLASDLERFAVIELHRGQRHRVEPGAGLHQQQFLHLSGDFGHQFDELPAQDILIDDRTADGLLELLQ